MKNFTLRLAMFTVVGLTLASCGGSGTGSTSSNTNYSSHQSTSILASEFVTSLNNVDGPGAVFSSKLVLSTSETLRSQQFGEDDWFVIWDAKYSEYKAVSLQYIRSITYYDYYSNNNAVAKEFRSITGSSDGDFFGDDYEVVDKLSSGYYEGQESGYLYEDELASKDVSLLAAEKEQTKFFKKAAAVSVTYNVSLETSMSMITLGAKMEKMLSRGEGEITADDQAALLDNVKSLTGVTLAEIQKSAENSATKTEVLAKIADKLGTSAQNLEEKILPEIFGITL